MTLVTGYDTPASAWDQDTTTQLNVSTVSPDVTPGDPEVGVAFMAPTSGRVLVFFGGGARDNSANDRVLMFAEFYTGTRAIDANKLTDQTFTDYATPGEADTYMYGSRMWVLSGLTPLAVHYARLVHAVDGSGGTADISTREVGVVPLP